MTSQLITEAIEKLEAAQETLRMKPAHTMEELERELRINQKWYEISKAISELRYVLSTL
jgi:hypothetical protein